MQGASLESKGEKVSWMKWNWLGGLNHRLTCGGYNNRQLHRNVP